jgi:putative hemolysin
LKLSGCAPLYHEAQHAGDAPFDERVLGALNVSAAAHRLDAIPPTGPVLVVANHPHGLIDGLALASLVRRIRTDVRLLANLALSRIPELSDVCFYVDPNEGHDAAGRSFAGLRSARRWLRDGHVLIVFPSGEVAHRQADDGSYEESRWRDTAVRLAEGVGASVISARIDGRNSALFYAAGRLHPRLRTALLGRELVNKRHATINVSFSASTIADEIAALPADSCLVSEGNFDVFCACAQTIPASLREIGRLRARTYHSAGEGNGKAIDLDQFDEHYLHLFVWDRSASRIVGAYRLAPTDRVTAGRGVRGLYTRTLFQYDARLLEQFGPALELGRSFVSVEYQRTYLPLMLLWRGIGAFLGRHPRYRVLFGPVSVSTRYAEASRQQLMAYLRRERLDSGLAALVQAMNPPVETSDAAACASVKDLDAPALLRHYLNLNARLIGFNVDRDFANALDVLMMVELASVTAAARRRYLLTAA